MSFVPSFENPDALLYHAELVHGMLCCPICEFRYDDFMQRQRHLKREHHLSSKEVKEIVPVRHLASA